MHGFLITISGGGLGDFAGPVVIALALGAVIGLERQWRQRIPRLRTNALVALGAALFELFAVLLTGQHGVDPTRIAAHVVSGIEHSRHQHRRHHLPRPEVQVRNWQRQADQFYDAIVAGEQRLAQTRLERLATGVQFIELCERVAAPALRRIGDDWAAGDVTIAVEHRASAICERLIAALAARQPKGRPRGVAVTATPPGDRHGLPALMAAGSLREDHWLVQHLATDLPAQEVGRLARDAQAYPGLLLLAGRPGESLYDLREFTRMHAEGPSGTS